MVKWVSKLRRRFFDGNVRQKESYYILVPFYSSTQATKPDHMTNKQLLRNSSVDIWAINIISLNRKTYEKRVIESRLSRKKS